MTVNINVIANMKCTSVKKMNLINELKSYLGVILTGKW